MISRLKFFCLLSSLLFAGSLFCFAPKSFAADAVSLTAVPVEVPAGGGVGKTRVLWKTEDNTEVKLYLVREDNSLLLVDKGFKGEYKADFISPNRTYEYRLYPADNLETPLASVFINGTREVNYFPDFLLIYQKFLLPWTLPLIVIFLLLIGARSSARRQKHLKRQKILITSALILAIAGAVVVISRERGLPYDMQPDPDAQETMDAARQMFEGNGYVTVFHDDKAQPPRYPPGFSIALLPFLSVGEYPANIIFGAKFYALFYFGLAVFAAWMLGGRLAALLAAIFIGVSPFAENYARIVLSEAFTAGLVLLVVVLLHKPSLRRALFAGAIVGILVTVRLQMLVCLPALLLALPTMRQRVWAMLAGAPFLLANGIFNWRTFGSFFKTGYNYWLPTVKPFALEFGFRTYSQADAYWIAPDLLRGWLMIWICPCEAGGPISALPNIIFYPLILLGFFWMFAPPLVPLYGLWTAWKNWHEPAAKFALWLCGFSILLFTFYFYKAPRFMAAASTVLLLLAAVELGKKLQRFIQPGSVFDSALHSPETAATGDKNFSG